MITEFFTMKGEIKYKDITDKIIGAGAEFIIQRNSIMKTILYIALIFISIYSVTAQQQNKEDSVRAIISRQKADKLEVDALLYLSSLQIQMDSAAKFAHRGLTLAKSINYEKGEADYYLTLSFINSRQKNISQALKFSFDALKIYKKIGDIQGEVIIHLILQGDYREAGDFNRSLAHAHEGVQIAEANNVIGKNIIFPGHRVAPLLLAEIGQTHLLNHRLDSALVYTQKSIVKNELFNGASWGFPVYLLATIQTELGDYESALKNYHLSIELSVKNGFYRDTLQNFSGMSTLFRKTGDMDSSIYYAQKVNRSWDLMSERKNLIEAVNNLGQSYKLMGKLDSAVKYIERTQVLKDSIYSIDKDREVQNIAINEKMKEQELTAIQVEYENKVKLYVLMAGLSAFLLITIILYRNSRTRQRAYSLLQRQKQDTDIQKNKVEQALGELRSTQSQLIQSEKMASLGELTAGIAHEIQNPLNFVNNFSEVSNELIDEMQEELKKGDVEEAKTISADIKQNLEKINHHGQRASSIVKGMLEHSRTSTGQKELTDINALCDEYLRLSYHGLRAKDKSFNASFETHFDPNLPKIEIVPQDIGRVLLNLINNAFFAVNEKANLLNLAKPGSEANLKDLTEVSPANLTDLQYEPKVTITTQLIANSQLLTANTPTTQQPNSLIISIKDNGSGIPTHIKDKIFQPFFTTKPTGQGTGLGLSLAYDIIKAHGGELKVETKENEGSIFTIQMPL